MPTLLDDVKERASFRYRAMTNQLEDFEKKDKMKFLNESQKEWVRENTNKITLAEGKKIVEEFKEMESKNEEFWGEIKKQKGG